jgi:formamidopyrimidine-DNA glycosylase
VPELPEVETIVRDLVPRVEGSRLYTPHLHKTDVLRQVSRARLLRVLTGNRVTELTRRAKHVVFVLASGHRLVVQPRMTGSLVIYDRRPTPEERQYLVLEARLDDGGRLAYRDVRRLGTIWLLDEKGWKTYTGRIGPEPLASDFLPAHFREQMRGTRQAIKKALMDQGRLAGVGNIYANEALFRARLDPSRRADRVSNDQLDRLYEAVRTVLSAAIAEKGTTVRDYRTGTGESGAFQDVLEVYGRGGSPCPRCGRTLVTTHAIDGRQTTFCYGCQT